MIMQARLVSASRRDSGMGGLLHRTDSLIKEKQSEHFPGTRTWFFDTLKRWFDRGDGQFYCLTGVGGTGKSVISAMISGQNNNPADHSILPVVKALRQDATVAWHFCRHDDPDGSQPVTILKSLHQQLLNRLDGFKQAFESTSKGKADLLSDGKVEKAFQYYLGAPIQQLHEQGPDRQPRLIVIDALDELPKSPETVFENVMHLVEKLFSKMPKWIRFFLTVTHVPTSTPRLPALTLISAYFVISTT